MSIDVFKKRFPNAFYLDPNHLPQLQSYLNERDWSDDSEQILEASKIGDGNMNCTVRVKTNRRSFILKQSRPWVEKYPHIRAPHERIAVEASFYNATNALSKVAGLMPKVLGYDPSSFILTLEDLGESSDLTSLYRGGKIERDEIDQLTDYLSALHSATVRPDQFLNLEMRKLNHEHIFHFPFLKHNGLNLDDITGGLANLAKSVAEDSVFVEKVTELGNLYLTCSGPSLLHGDFYPGSWLKNQSGLFVIDPEFCFAGPVEFDLGVMLAHLILTSQPHNLISHLFTSYRASKNDFDRVLCTQFAGVEIVRRIIGVAQLPLDISIEEKEEFLKTARTMVASPAAEVF
ncbi:MAG: phosphotransferase [Bacteriovoracia bacterium]